MPPRKRRYSLRWTFERSLRPEGVAVIAGVDEVGRGCWAGPVFAAAAILPDGRLVIQGGEYNGGDNGVWTNQGAIYDPVKNKWTPLTPPAGWGQIGDAQSVILSNGTFLLGDPLSRADATLNAKTLKYTVLSGEGKADGNDEEG